MALQEHVATKLKSMLLDPKLSSYKTGGLGRVMVSFDQCSVYLMSLNQHQRHIRLNPSQYQIPSELKPSIPSKAFIGAISKALVSGRSAIKQKVCSLFYNFLLAPVHLLVIMIDDVCIGGRKGHILPRQGPFIQQQSRVQ